MLIGKSFKTMEELEDIFRAEGLEGDIYTLYTCKWDYRLEDTHIAVRIDADNTQTITDIRLA